MVQKRFSSTETTGAAKAHALVEHADRAYEEAKHLYHTMQDVHAFLTLEWIRVVECYERWHEKSVLLCHSLCMLEMYEKHAEHRKDLEEVLNNHVSFSETHLFFEQSVQALKAAAAHARAYAQHQTPSGGSEPASVAGK
jgi:hypothetical protein